MSRTNKQILGVVAGALVLCVVGAVLAVVVLGPLWVKRSAAQAGPGSGSEGEVFAVTPVPTLTLNPDAGTPGQAVVVMGGGFGPGTTVALRLGVPNAGLSKQDLAIAIAGTDGGFEIEVAVPSKWPGRQAPVVERELVIAAVDDTRGQTLAVASFTNTQGR